MGFWYGSDLMGFGWIGLFYMGLLERARLLEYQHCCCGVGSSWVWLDHGCVNDVFAYTRVGQ